MKYLHTMVRITDLETSLDFYINKLGLVEKSRQDVPKGKFTLIFLSAPGDDNCMIELTHNWDGNENYANDTGRNFGHIAYQVENIYDLCHKLKQSGVVINRPPRDGHMAFVRSPDNISIELLQAGDALPPQEPWASMENQGQW